MQGPELLDAVKVVSTQEVVVDHHFGTWGLSSRITTGLARVELCEVSKAQN